MPQQNLRVMVTGGSGFIGSAVCRHLAGQNNVAILNYDKLTYAASQASLAMLEGKADYQFVQGDVADAARVSATIKAFRPDVVMHLAAESHVDRSITGPGDFIQTNIVGTYVMLQAALEHWQGLEGAEKAAFRFLHVSTDEVYGSIAEGSWDETRPLEPNSPYSASKAGSDLLARSYFRTHGLNLSITRCSNNYGPYHFPEKVIPLFVTNLIDDKHVPLYGEGNNIRDWLHVDDHTRGIAMVLVGGRAGEIYNIGGGTELTNKELTQLLLDATGKDWSYVDRVADRLGHDLRYSVDISKIRAELGYEPLVPFEQGLADVVQWYRDNRAWWEPLKARAAL